MRTYKTKLFTRRHYEWLTDMCITLNLNQKQVKALSEMLKQTNPEYKPDVFLITITNKRNKTSGGI
tara:strand:+ start:162 stop:359 length:198 start_codon:yes stop_codon:yes gene_type:complete